MRLRPATVLAALLVPALLALGGCEWGEDDEMVPPTRTVTASPTTGVTVVPSSVPVGRGGLTTGQVVWAQGSTLHVGSRSVDLAPAGIDAFVAAPGGVYVLHRGELWFTDLARLRGTGITGVTGLGVTADGARILVTVQAADGESTHAFDTTTGRAVTSAGLEPVTAEDRLRGPDRRGVRVPAGFRLAGWAGATTFYGLAGPAAHPSSVVSCDLETRACLRLGTVADNDPVLFGTGT